MDSHLADGRDTTVREEDACRARWALVKALVLGKPLSEIPGIPRGALPLVEQRDAVFADLADTARAEAAALEAQQRAESRYPYHRFHRVGDGTHEGPRPSHARLAAYVEFLVEQVGVLR